MRLAPPEMVYISLKLLGILHLIEKLECRLKSQRGRIMDPWPIRKSADTVRVRELGLAREVTAQDVESVCGLVYRDCVAKLFPNLSEFELMKAISVFDRFEQQALRLQGGVLYPECQKVLEKLSRQLPLFLVSNCQHWYLENFFAHHPLEKFFQDVETHGRTGLSKAKNLRLLIERNRLSRPVYVGDTEGDYRACQESGIDFVFARYGFGDVESDMVIDELSELQDALKVTWVIAFQ